MRRSQLWGPRLLSQHSLDLHRAFWLRIPTAMPEAAQKRLRTSPRVQSLDARCKGALSPGGSASRSAKWFQTLFTEFVFVCRGSITVADGLAWQT